MIDLSYIFALVSFYLVMYITPGPNNAMILASGVKFGFIKTIPVILGITIGHNFQLLLVCFGFGKIFQIYPVIQFFLKILCAAYLTYLSYKILGSFIFFALVTIEPKSDPLSGSVKHAAGIASPLDILGNQKFF